MDVKARSKSRIPGISSAKSKTVKSPKPVRSKPKVEAIPLWKFIKSFMESEEGYQKIVSSCDIPLEDPTSPDANKAAMRVL